MPEFHCVQSIFWDQLSSGTLAIKQDLLPYLGFSDMPLFSEFCLQKTDMHHFLVEAFCIPFAGFFI